MFMAHEMVHTYHFVSPMFSKKCKNSKLGLHSEGADYLILGYHLC
jgi:hypothetical protein